MTIKLLEWDTQFFGYKIGSVTLTNETPEDLLVAILNEESSSFRFISLFLPENKTLSSRICEEWNIALADQKVVFHKKLTRSSYTTSHHEQIESVMYQDHTKFINLAVASGVQSRFRLDPHFSIIDFERMYEEWIKNTLSGQIADNCYTYSHQQHPIGVVTVKKKKDYTNIGIIAVESNFRGKGVGNKLLYAAEKYSYENGFQEITLATQQRNIGACHFYQQNGYLPKTTTNIYHFWNDEYHTFQ